MNKKIVGVFKSREEAKKSIERLKRDGYLDSEISVIAKYHEDIEILKGMENVDINATEINENAVEGALTGGAIGGVGALLLELTAITIPGVGPFLAAGPLAATLLGALAGGAVGGVVGSLVDLGVPEKEAKGYEDYINKGYIVVLVDEYPDRDVYENFYENNSLIRDRYSSFIPPTDDLNK